ncbi:MAG: arginine--tRNA ligase [bacterium]|nr:arginine--tRNA ligase [bacterium]
MSVAEIIRKGLVRSLDTVGIKVVAENVSLERPKELSHGDYATGAALQYAKQIGMPPIKLAEKIVAGLGTLDGVKSVEVVKPGFINFRLTPDAINAVLQEVISNEKAWGKNKSQKGSRVMVEYTDPNPFKEFHIGHLMSNAIGESISRLVQYSGAEVKRANYQGDVGPHVAKAIWSIQKNGWDAHDAKVLGKAYAEGAKAYESDTNVKSEIDALNSKIYDRSDKEINAIYDAGREASLKHFEEIYKTLGTKFDFYFFEGETAPKGMEIVRANKDVFPESDGAIVFKGERHGLHTRVFITSRGLPTYEAKELGLLEMKAEKWPFDESVTITANEQNEYFQVVKAALGEVLPELASKVKHVSHGMMRLTSGKMSSRTGVVITGESLIEELKERATARAKVSRSDNPAQLAEQIAISAIKYQILRQASGRDIIFDRERALSLEGDSGPYLQYAHARAKQVVERAHAEGIKPKLDIKAWPNDLSAGALAQADVSRLVTRFPEVVLYAANELEPHLLVNYLIGLAGAFNSWYAQVHILDGTKEAPHKVAIVDAVRATLKNGLWLLGISAPEKM